MSRVALMRRQLAGSECYGFLDHYLKPYLMIMCYHWSRLIILLVQQVPFHLHGRVAPCNRLTYKSHPLKTHSMRTPQTTFLPSLLPASTKSHLYHVALPDHPFLQILTATKLSQISMARRSIRTP
jgi:hypothetical protein